MKSIIVLAGLLASAGCTTDRHQTAARQPAAPTQSNGSMERALIIGSAEAPDPVLARVRQLEQEGLVKEVVVLESFPLQIQLSAPRAIIDELNTIPRIGTLR